MAQDILQQLQAIRERTIDNLEAQHQELLFKTLRRLEQEVVNIASELPTKTGELYSTRIAIEIRPRLQQAIEEFYLKPVQTFIKDYDRLQELL